MSALLILRVFDMVHLSPCDKTQEMALKKPYFSEFLERACFRNPLDRLPGTWQIHIRPQKISKPVCIWVR